MIFYIDKKIFNKILFIMNYIHNKGNKCKIKNTFTIILVKIVVLNI